MVEEEGKYYVIMDVEGAPSASVEWTEAEYRYGRYLIAAHDPVLADFLKKEKRTAAGILRALTAQEPRTERTAQRIFELQDTLNVIEETEHEMQGNH